MKSFSIGTIISLIYDHKATTFMLAFLGSVALEELFINYDWGHSILGMVGFTFGWALSNIDNHEEEEKSKKYWVSKFLMSVILPVFITNYIAAKLTIDHIFVAFVIGIFPDLVAFGIKKFIKKKTNE